jgi:NADPH-dependent 2,4-dienoyl-CoA reductase/sulfur reductase-like enzyme
LSAAADWQRTGDGFLSRGKAVTLVDSEASILSSLMPPEVSSRLQHRLTGMGVHLLLKSQLMALEKTETAFAPRWTGSAV